MLAQDLTKAFSRSLVAMGILLTFGVPSKSDEYPARQIDLGYRSELSAVEASNLGRSKFGSIYLDLDKRLEFPEAQALADALAPSYLYSNNCSKNPQIDQAILGIISFHKPAHFTENEFIERFFKPKVSGIKSSKYYNNYCSWFASARMQKDASGWSYYSALEQIANVANHLSSGVIRDDFKFLWSDYIAREFDRNIEKKAISSTPQSDMIKDALVHPQFPYTNEWEIMEDANPADSQLSLNDLQACKKAASNIDNYRVADKKVVRKVTYVSAKQPAIIIYLQDRLYTNHWIEMQADYKKGGPIYSADKSTFFYVCKFRKTDSIGSVELYKLDDKENLELGRKINM